MKKFVSKAIIFLTVIASYALFCEYFFFKDKELLSIEKITEEQCKSQTEKYYFRKFFDNSPSLYKLMMTVKKNAEILVVGQSTVLQFRDFMFHPLEKSFYNMGPSLTSINELQNLIQLIKNKKIKKPKVLIIGLDLSLVKKTNNSLPVNTATIPQEDEVFHIKYHAAAAQSLIKFIYQNGFDKTYSKKNCGFGYLGSRGTGYRNDGSLHYAQDIADYLKTPVFRDGINYKGLLKNKDYIFTYPFEVDPVLVNNLVLTLKQLRQADIQTLIFFPPVSNDFFAYFSKDKSFYRCFKQYLSIQDTLKKNNFDFIPFSTPEKLGLPDNYMLDGIHPSEVLVGMLLHKYLIQHTPEGLLNKVDSMNLKQLIISKNTIPLSFMRDTAVFSNFLKITTVKHN
ncbi:hypothetical protein [Mucilaginibacter sp. CSA2-8R]|uniref:hypothetical protein n=1 Tax=Mucilaginibacter sp. CSA2-8R TaxID=3141542 RepID=UPI00315D5C57